MYWMTDAGSGIPSSGPEVTPCPAVPYGGGELCAGGGRNGAPFLAPAVSPAPALCSASIASSSRAACAASHLGPCWELPEEQVLQHAA